jgi:membrane protein DedA with SNARE-associated domain
MKRALRAVRRRPWRSALLVRFAFGARLLLPLACGAAHVSPFKYLVGSAISSIVWSALFTEVGYLFGEAAIVALRRMENYGQYVGGLAAGLAVVAALIWWDRKRRVPRPGPG